MQTKTLIFLNTLLVFGLLSGCASTSGRVAAVQPGWGATQVFDHSYDVVFPAAVRVMHLNNEKIEEASPETGRIVSLQTFGARGIFLTKLPGGKTRVELSGSMSLWGIGFFSGGSGAFFTLLREQIVVYEKIKIRDELQHKKKNVDKDLRTIFKPKDSSTKTPLPEPEPAPEPSRRQRHRLRR